eukprot:GAHX01005873.1.p2 GENE.GAHX01005873.1~~GAHX01005873.1.p2  ORF type:complete len:57 (+),score=0.42 GAHX01005873.1:611-781(+)
MFAIASHRFLLTASCNSVKFLGQSGTFCTVGKDSMHTSAPKVFIRKIVGKKVLKAS